MCVQQPLCTTTFSVIATPLCGAAAAGGGGWWWWWWWWWWWGGGGGGGGGQRFDCNFKLVLFGIDCNFKLVLFGIDCNFKLVLFGTHIYLEHFLLNGPQMNSTRPHWWSVNDGPGNVFVPSDNKLLPQPMYPDLCRHMASLGIMS